VVSGLIFAMAVPNILGLYILAPVVKGELREYTAKLRSGEIQPTRCAGFAAADTRVGSSQEGPPGSIGGHDTA